MGWKSVFLLIDSLLMSRVTAFFSNISVTDSAFSHNVDFLCTWDYLLSHIEKKFSIRLVRFKCYKCCPVFK